MPFYQLIIRLSVSSPGRSTGQDEIKEIRVIRNWASTDLDRIYLVCSAKCRDKWGDKLLDFDCRMISRHSSLYIQYVRAQAERRGLTRQRIDWKSIQKDRHGHRYPGRA
ncbi:MAG: hypothetical protein P4L51_06030 [Puia sp.]|nr:hypothetical protein [Puia sp.]